MKTKKKLLIALLSATCLTAGAFGLVACKAEKGEQGATGPAGAAGTAGSDGKSAYQIYVDSLGPNDVQLKEDEWLASLIGSNGQPGETGNGIESVELSSDGRNLIITYTNGSSETVLLPESFTHKHSYGIDYTTIIESSSASEGLGYKKCLSNTCDHIEVIALPKLATPASGDGSDATPYVIADGMNVNDKAFYKFTANKTSGAWDKVNVQFSPTEEAKYKVTINSSSVTYNGRNEFTVVLDAFEEFKAPLSVSSSAGSSLDFTVTVERMTTPEKGSAEFPYTIQKPYAAGSGYAVDVELSTTADKEVYYVLKQNDGVKYMFEFESNVTVTALGASIEGNDPAEVVSGEVFSLSSDYQYYYSIAATDGEIAFSFSAQGDPGDRNNPIPVTLDTATEVTDSAWYAVTFSSPGKYTVEATNDSADLVSFNIYTDNSLSFYESQVASFNGQSVFTHEFTADTYYFQTYYTGFEFNIRAYDPAKDDGKSEGAPITAAIDTDYAVAEGEVKYLVYTADANAIVSFVTEGDVTATVYGGDSFSNGDYEHPNTIEDDSVLLSAGSSVSIMLAGRSGGGKLKIEKQDATTPVALTFKAVDFMDGSTPISGAVVKVYKGGQLVETSAATGADGTVSLNLLPDYYSVTVEKAGYVYVSGDSISVKTQPGQFEFMLAEAEEHTVKVTSGGSGVENVEVYYSIYNEYTYDYVYRVSAITNSDGEATIAIIKNASSHSNYYQWEISLGADLDGTDYEYASAPTWNDSDPVHEIDLVQYVPVNLVNGTDATVSTSSKGYYKFSTDLNLHITVSGGHVDYLTLDDGFGYVDTVVSNGNCTYAMFGDTNTDLTLACNDNMQQVCLVIIPDAGQTATVTITV